MRVGVGTSADDRKDAFTVFKDGRVCTADGMVSRCGEEQFAAEARRAREAALPGEVDALQKKVAALTGKETEASGMHAVASGEGSAAEGALSSAMGYHTTAQSYAEVVLGRYKCARPRIRSTHTPGLTRVCVPPSFARSQLSASRFDDSPSPHAWTKHDAVLRVGVGTGEIDRKDAFTVFKDGRVCTADGTVSRCSDTNEVNEAVRAEEAAKDAILEELRTEVGDLKAEMTQMKATMSQMAAALGIPPPARS